MLINTQKESLVPSSDGRRVHVIALVNQKGGSGKTTTCLNVAGALADRELSVLVVDLDPQASFTVALDVEPSRHGRLSDALLRDDVDLTALIVHTPVPHIDVIPGDPELRRIELALSEVEGREMRLRMALQASMRRLRDKYDYILIDCPPALGYLTTNASNAANEVILPVNLDKMGMNALRASLRTVNLVRQSTNVALEILGILPTQVNMRTKLDQARDEHLRSLYNSQVFETVIPTSVQVKEAIEMAVPVTTYAKRGAIAKRYRKLVDEIIDREARHA